MIEKGEESGEAREVTKGAKITFICPVGPFFNNYSNNHLFQSANYFVDSVLITLYTLVLVFTTPLHVRTVMSLLQIRTLKCREVI